MEEGEKCTAYFHACVKRRGDTSNVDKLLINGREVEESGEVFTNTCIRRGRCTRVLTRGQG